MPILGFTVNLAAPTSVASEMTWMIFPATFAISSSVLASIMMQRNSSPPRRLTVSSARIDA